MSRVPEGQGRRPGLERGVRLAVSPRPPLRAAGSIGITRRPRGPWNAPSWGPGSGWSPAVFQGRQGSHAGMPTGPSPSTMAALFGKGQKGAPAPPKSELLFPSAGRQALREAGYHVSSANSLGGPPRAPNYSRGGYAFGPVVFTGPARCKALEGVGPESQEEW